MSSSIQEIVCRYIAATGGADGIHETAVEGLHILRTGTTALPHLIIYKPALCITLQGAKQVMFGDSVFDYGPMQALIVTLELPGVGRVTRASPGEPYLGLVVPLDLAALGDVMGQLGDVSKADADVGPGIFVSELEGPVADCVLRLVSLLAMPAEATTILQPGIMRELSYWLLTGPNGRDIRKLALGNGHLQRVAEAISVLRADYTRPVRVEQLATVARMSASSFHQHFKALTSMTPLQYQKQLRLIEARRLLMAENAAVATAAYRVGYESISQFSREYARMFGEPPRRDVSRLRRLAA